MKGLFSWNFEGKGFKQSGLSRGVVSHQGGFQQGFCLMIFGLVVVGLLSDRIKVHLFSNCG